MAKDTARHFGKPESQGAHVHGHAPPTQPASHAPGAKWTCPMHPQIVRDDPGSCPICGMALEPVAPTAATGPNPELADMTQRFWIGLALTIPVFVLEMGGHLFGWTHMIGAQVSNWIQ